MTLNEFQRLSKVEMVRRWDQFTPRMLRCASNFGPCFIGPEVGPGCGSGHKIDYPVWLGLKCPLCGKEYWQLWHDMLTGWNTGEHRQRTIFESFEDGARSAQAYEDGTFPGVDHQGCREAYRNRWKQFNDMIRGKMVRALETLEATQRNLPATPGMTEAELVRKLDEMTRVKDFSGAGNLVLKAVRGCKTPFAVNTLVKLTPTLIARRLGVPDQFADRFYRSPYRDEHLPMHLHGTAKEDRETQCLIDSYSLGATWSTLPFPEDKLVPFYKLMAVKGLRAMADQLRTVPVAVNLMVIEEIVVSISR